MNAKSKRRALYGVLGLAVTAAAYMDQHSVPNDVNASGGRVAASESAPRRHASTLVAAAENSIHLENFDRSPVEASDSNPFAVKTWATVTPITAATTPVKETPVTPPMPFSYAGKLLEADGRWAVYLVKGETSFDVGQFSAQTNTNSPSET